MSDEIKNQFSEIQAQISYGIECMLNAQEKLADLMCHQLNLPLEAKDYVLTQIHKLTGIKRVSEPV